MVFVQDTEDIRLPLKKNVIIQTNFRVIQIGGRSCVSWLVRIKIWEFSTKRLFSDDLLKK